jgi:hypothetical protein
MSPPSWFAATRKPTRPVAAPVALAWTLFATARTPATPIDVLAVNQTDPKCSLATAARSAEPKRSFASPISNS